MRLGSLLLLIATCARAQEALTDRERIMLDRIDKLERRLAALETKAGVTETEPVAAAKAREPEAPAKVASREASIMPTGTTLNVFVDGYYGYNFNRPFNSVNALRAYDVSGNSFSLNQVGIMIERAPDAEKGRRIGGRIDLMFGQATDALQGSFANERRPEVFRNVFQAYGTYIAPVGKGLTVDFGKWASSFGLENNYTKDQWNYSRSYWFNFLPYYHMGFRATYPVTGKLNASYWVTNGLNQTEDFNGFKSQAFLMTYSPSPKVSASLNYFIGQEQRTVNSQTPDGRSHILDAYFTWQASDRWAFSAEADYVVSRVSATSAPQLATGGAGYASYRVHPRLHLNGRFEYLSDAGKLFSGTAQSLKEATVTAAFDLASGFQMRWEVRRDWSNTAYFPAQRLDQRKREQTTAMLGLIWWFGGKQGAW